MIEVTARLKCETCKQLFLREYWDEERVHLLMLTAELAGWKVNRLARDAYYGKSWCQTCREDRCAKCRGRGYYPKWPLDPIYGEPERKECEDCDGRGY
jgi:hypothetical protein